MNIETIQPPKPEVQFVLTLSFSEACHIRDALYALDGGTRLYVAIRDAVAEASR